MWGLQNYRQFCVGTRPTPPAKPRRFVCYTKWGGGGEKFSKLDLSRAYQKIVLDEDSREYVTINSHKSLYRPTRLPFGVSSASAIFQSKLEQVLQGIPMVVCRVDDILISEKNDQEHLEHLDEVWLVGKHWLEVKTKQMPVHAANC